MKTKTTGSKKSISAKENVSGHGMDSLQGQFLVAMPLMGDKRFVESVLYVVEHNEQGAMAIAINDIFPNIQFGDVLADVKLNAGSKGEHRQIEVSTKMAEQPVLRGGPVQTTRGFVLHASDIDLDGLSFPINKQTNLSADPDVLGAMAAKNEPEKTLFALGYCGWHTGQLEGELAQNSWLTVPFSEELLFEVDYKKRYDKALGLLGINRASLSAFSGRA